MAKTTTIDLTPTDEGYASLRQLYRESVDKHQADLRLLERIQEDRGFYDFAVQRFAEGADDLMSEALAMLIVSKEQAVRVLSESIAEITRYLNSKLPQHEDGDFLGDDMDLHDSERR